MPAPVSQPLELAYATYSAGVVSWQRDGDLILITVHEPRPTPRGHLLRVIVTFAWTLLFVFGSINVVFLGGARKVLGLATAFIVGLILVALRGSSASPRRLLIRVNARKLLIDEYQPGRFGGDGISVSVTGRAWEAGEIVSVAAAGSSLRVKTCTRRLARMSITGYDPGDLAFASDTIRKILAQGVDAWLASQTPVAPQAAP